MMIARATGLVSIPGDLTPEEAVPLLCAGIATFNALKKCGAEAGDMVVVQGIGGLGHLALQYARKMGFRVVAVGRGADIAQDALALGAHLYFDAKNEDPVARLQSLGGAKAIVTTIGDVQAVAALTGLSLRRAASCCSEPERIHSPYPLVISSSVSAVFSDRLPERSSRMRKRWTSAYWPACALGSKSCRWSARPMRSRGCDRGRPSSGWC